MYIDTPRLPGGYFTLLPPENFTITAGFARIHLFNGTLDVDLVISDANGLSATSSSLTILAPASRPTDILITGTALEHFEIDFTPRAANGNRGHDPHPNPPAKCGPSDKSNATIICEQRLLAGGGFAIARRVLGTTMVVSLANSVPAGIPSNQTAVAMATQALEKAWSVGPDAIFEAHAHW